MEGATLPFSYQAPARICIISYGVQPAALAIRFSQYSGELVRLSGFENINSTTVTTDGILLSFRVKIVSNFKVISEPPGGACPQTP